MKHIKRRGQVEYLESVLSAGTRHTMEDLKRIVAKRCSDSKFREAYLQIWAVLPWLVIEDRGDDFKFLVDRDLKKICDRSIAEDGTMSLSQTAEIAVKNINRKLRSKQ